MRKTMLILLLLIVAGVLGSYYVAGMKTETQIQHLIALANRNPDLQISIDSYRRGWFESSALLNVKVHKPAQQEVSDGKMQMTEAKDYDFKTSVVIYHGPIVITPNKFAFGTAYATTEFGLPQQVLEKFDGVFATGSTKPVVLGYLFLNYNNSADIKLSVPSFSLIKKEGQNSVQWSGVVSNWYVSSNLRHVKGDVKFDGMKFKQEQNEGNVGAIKIQYDVMEDSNDIWSGNASLELPTMEFLVNNQKKLQLTNFKLESDSKVNNDTLNSTLQSSLEKVEVDGTSYGPGVLKLSIDNLDAKALKDIQQQLKSYDANNASVEQKQMMLMALLPKLSELVSKGAAIEIKQLNMTMPQGEVKINARVELPKDTNIANPMLIISALQVNASLQIPTALMQLAMSNFMQAKIKQTQIMQQSIAQPPQVGQAIKPQPDAKMAAPTTAAAPTAAAPTAAAPTAQAANEQKPSPLSDEEIEKMANEQAEQYLKRLVASGVLIKNGDLYNVVLAYQGGKLVVNGKSFESSMLQ